HPALVRIGTGGEQELEDLDGVVPRRAARRRPATRQGRDQRRKAGVIAVVRIGAAVEQEADERERAVVDRVLEAVTDRQRSAHVRKSGGVAEGGAQPLEVTGAEGGVDSPEDPALATAFGAAAHRRPSPPPGRPARSPSKGRPPPGTLRGTR